MNPRFAQHHFEDPSKTRSGRQGRLGRETRMLHAPFASPRAIAQPNSKASARQSDTQSDVSPDPPARVIVLESNASKTDAATSTITVASADAPPSAVPARTTDATSGGQPRMAPYTRDVVVAARSQPTFKKALRILCEKILTFLSVHPPEEAAGLSAADR